MPPTQAVPSSAPEGHWAVQTRVWGGCARTPLRRPARLTVGGYPHTQPVPHNQVQMLTPRWAQAPLDTQPGLEWRAQGHGQRRA